MALPDIFMVWTTYRKIIRGGREGVGEGGGMGRYQNGTKAKQSFWNRGHRNGGTSLTKQALPKVLAVLLHKERQKKKK